MQIFIMENDREKLDSLLSENPGLNVTREDNGCVVVNQRIKDNHVLTMSLGFEFRTQDQPLPNVRINVHRGLWNRTPKWGVFTHISAIPLDEMYLRVEVRHRKKYVKPAEIIAKTKAGLEILSNFVQLPTEDRFVYNRWVIDFIEPGSFLAEEPKAESLDTLMADTRSRVCHFRYLLWVLGKEIAEIKEIPF